MYPLLVACKSISSLRRTAAEQVVEEVRQHSPHSARLVEQVGRFDTFLLVSKVQVIVRKPASHVLGPAGFQRTHKSSHLMARDMA